MANIELSVYAVSIGNYLLEKRLSRFSVSNHMSIERLLDRVKKWGEHEKTILRYSFCAYLRIVINVTACTGAAAGKEYCSRSWRMG
jgi:hypothetical protein